MSEHDIRDVPGWDGCGRCAICGAFEGEIPTDCPGRLMTQQERDDVYEGRTDYLGDSWILPARPARLGRP